MNLVILVFSLHDLGDLNAHSKKSIYRAANAVFGKFGKTCGYVEGFKNSKSGSRDMTP